MMANPRKTSVPDRTSSSNCRDSSIEREFDADIKTTLETIAKAEAQLAKHRWWWLSGLGDVLWRAFEIVFTRLMGGRSRKQLITATSTKQMNRGRRSHAEAQAELDQLREKLANLESDRQKQLAALETVFRPESLALEKIEISPRKSDIDVGQVMLVWLPWQVDAEGQAQPLY